MFGESRSAARRSTRRAFALGAIGLSAAACSYDWEAFVVDEGVVAALGPDGSPTTPGIDGEAPGTDGATALDATVSETDGSQPGSDGAPADDSGVDASSSDAAPIDAGGVDAPVDSTVVVEASVDACTPSSACLAEGSTCALGCAQTSATCQNACNSMPCRSKCRQTERSCRDSCGNVCRACALAAGCAAVDACLTATQ